MSGDFTIKRFKSGLERTIEVPLSHEHKQRLLHATLFEENSPPTRPFGVAPQGSLQRIIAGKQNEIESLSNAMSYEQTIVSTPRKPASAPYCEMLVTESRFLRALDLVLITQAKVEWNETSLDKAVFLLNTRKQPKRIVDKILKGSIFVQIFNPIHFIPLRNTHDSNYTTLIFCSTFSVSTGSDLLSPPRSDGA